VIAAITALLAGDLSATVVVQNRQADCSQNQIQTNIPLQPPFLF
jgi:hypothetical protein